MIHAMRRLRLIGQTLEVALAELLAGFGAAAAAELTAADLTSGSMPGAGVISVPVVTSPHAFIIGPGISARIRTMISPESGIVSGTVPTET